MKIKQAFFHTNLFIPGIGDLGASMVSGSGGKYPALLMTLLKNGAGIQLDLNGKRAVVPMTNVKLAVLDTDAKN